MDDGWGRGRRTTREGCTSIPTCSTPRLVARWFSGLRKGRPRREDDVAPPIDCSTNCPNHLVSLVPETPRRDPTFDLGIGCFLFYLISTSKNELNKMVELRKQMEMILGYAKEELQRKELTQAKLFKCSALDGTEGPKSNDCQKSPQVVSVSFSMEESSTSIVCDPKLKHDVHESKQYQNDQIDCRLEGKPEFLQIDSETRKKHKKPSKDRKKAADKSESHTLISRGNKEEVIYPYGGVCPYELERKLHQLLEKRQQEQIQELEAAVRRVQRRLHEKETEVSWWKDAASLLSQRVPESCRTGLEVCVPESSRIGLDCIESPGTGLEKCEPISCITGLELCYPDSSVTGLQQSVPEAHSLS